MYEGDSKAIQVGSTVVIIAVTITTTTTIITATTTTTKHFLQFIDFQRPREV